MKEGPPIHIPEGTNARQQQWLDQLNRAAAFSRYVENHLPKADGARLLVRIDPAETQTGEELRTTVDQATLNGAHHIVYSRLEDLKAEGLGEPAKAIVDWYRTEPPET